MLVGRARLPVRGLQSLCALLVASVLIAAAGGVPQSEQLQQSAEHADKPPRSTAGAPGDAGLEEGEVPPPAFPKSLNDFFKGRWVVANATGAPRFRHTSGDIVFQIVTRAHGREMKRLHMARKPGTDGPPKASGGTSGSSGAAEKVAGDAGLGDEGTSASASAHDDLPGSGIESGSQHKDGDGPVAEAKGRKPHSESAQSTNASDPVVGTVLPDLDDTPLGVRSASTHKKAPARVAKAQARAQGTRRKATAGADMPQLIEDVTAHGAAQDSGSLRYGAAAADSHVHSYPATHSTGQNTGERANADDVDDAWGTAGGTAEERGELGLIKMGKMIVEEVDMVQVDMVIRDGPYSTVRDMHTYMQGLYRKSSGRLQLWTVCSSPECGMYMLGHGLGGFKDGVSQTGITAPGALGVEAGRNATERGRDEATPFAWMGNDHAHAGGGVHFGGSARGAAGTGSRMGRGRCIFVANMQVVLPLIPDNNEEAGASADGDDSEVGPGLVQSGERDFDRVVLEGNITSENCGFSMHVNASAMNFEVYYSKAMHYTLMVTAASFCQVLLLVRQIDYSNSRSAAVKVSLLTIGQQAVMDSYLCLMHLTTGIVVEALFNAFATAAFFKFMIFSIFEMRYLLIIWKARRPQGFQEGWNSMRRELSMLYSRFYGCLLAGIILIYQLQRHSGVLILIVYSFWVPQIIHNIHHDHRKPLLVRYIVGMSATRLLIPLYALACPNNFLHAEPNYGVAAMLLAWVALQVAVLLLQHYKGPRCCIPRRFRPDKYDYYRRVPMVATGEGEDCAICMMPVGGSSDSSPRVVTPCDHVFHQDCLKRWMDIKMECPVCRRTVPDLDDD